MNATLEPEKAVKPTWMEEWKLRFDTLKSKLDLGKVDAREGVEELERDLKAYLGKLDEALDELMDKYPKTKELKGRLDEMRVQLNLAQAEGLDVLERETKKLRDKLHAWKWDALDWLKDQSDEHIAKVKSALDDELEFYTAQLELLNVRAHLGQKDARDNWNEMRDNLKIRLQELRSKVETKAEAQWDVTRHDLAGQLRKWADRLD